MQRYDRQIPEDEGRVAQQGGGLRADQQAEGHGEGI